MTTSATEAEPGLREQKRLATRQALVDATLQLSAENGYSNVTVEQICEDAGVSRRTFFNYFPSKEDALLRRDEAPVHADLADAFVTAGKNRPRRSNGLTDTVLDDLVTLMATGAERSNITGDTFALMLKAIEVDPRLLLMLHEAGKRMDGVYADLIAQREGVPADDPNVTALLALLGGITQRTLGAYFAPGNTTSYTELLVDNVAVVRALFTD